MLFKIAQYTDNSDIPPSLNTETEKLCNLRVLCTVCIYGFPRYFYDILYKTVQTIVHM